MRDPKFTDADLTALKEALRLFDEGETASDLVAAVRAVVEKNRPKFYCTCACGAPLVSTMEFIKKEWFCQACGMLYAFLSTMSKPWSQELEDRHEALDADFRRHSEDRSAMDRKDLARLDHARAHLSGDSDE